MVSIRYCTKPSRFRQQDTRRGAKAQVTELPTSSDREPDLQFAKVPNKGSTGVYFDLRQFALLDVPRFI